MTMIGITVWVVPLLLMVFIATCKKWRGQVRAVLLLLLVGGYMFLLVVPDYKLHEKNTEGKERLAKAEAMFQERCKTAGEFIHRTAENVEGVFLLKLRTGNMNERDQYRMDDPYGRDLGGDGYIVSFVRGSFQANTSRRGPEVPGAPERLGYFYVDAIDPLNGKRYRYAGGMKVVGRKDTTARNVKLALERDPNYDLNIYSYKLDRILAPDPAPRYGVTYDDISTREERDYWIAGSSLRVIDLETNEVMAERIGYMMDRGQGNQSGGRMPWLFAANHACPSFFRNPNLPPSGPGAAAQRRQTQDFVEKVLHPIPRQPQDIVVKVHPTQEK